MRILILGATGMLGHELFGSLSRREEAFGTVRILLPHPFWHAFDLTRIHANVDTSDQNALRGAFEWAKPDAVVNCVGIVKQSVSASDPLISIQVNSTLPHQLGRLCRLYGARLLHISTDCVFSGTKGAYSEADIPDPVDLYGRSKLLGEVTDQPHVLTLRTSMIGFELHTSFGLMEWLLSRRNGVLQGYRKAVFSGLTTAALSDVIHRVLLEHPTLCGLYHVATEPISKHDLLQKINEQWGLGVTIEVDETFQCDRSLDSTKFRQATGWNPPSWHKMIEQLNIEDHSKLHGI